MSPLAAGATIRNGIDGWHTAGAGWAEPLTVVRRDAGAYCTERYIVANRSGRHHVALSRIAY